MTAPRGRHHALRALGAELHELEALGLGPALDRAEDAVDRAGRMDDERDPLERDLRRVVFNRRSGVSVFLRRRLLGGSMRHPEFELAVDAIGGVLALEVHGRVVAGAHDALVECLEQAVRGGRPVVLDPRRPRRSTTRASRR